MPVGLNVKTQTVRSNLVREERPPEVLRNSCVIIWTIHTWKASQPNYETAFQNLLSSIKELFYGNFLKMHYKYMELINLYLQSWTLNPWSRADTVGYSEKSICIRGGYRLRSTYSCLAVMEMAHPWLCLVSSLCCWRWSRIDCGANGPLHGAPANAPWLEGMVLLFFCSDLCPL